ncbi:MAG: cysteine synthase family protein [Deltaproteobacteria bacterium]|nr:cysteine synthase family protein [Deltaproteobacteria bacterium]
MQNRSSGSILNQIGKTPLLRIEQLVQGILPPAVELFAKAEWFNPGGSVKDRPALRMILDGIREGELIRGKAILDATSGNTGIAYALIGRTLQYPVRLIVPENVSVERKLIFEAYGVEVTYTDPLEGIDGARRLAKEMAEREPQHFFYPDQYNNPSNWKAHYESTGREIYEQTGGRVTHFVAGLGTTGTFVGVTRRLKEFSREIRCISFQPDSSFHGLEGLKHLPSVEVPGIYDRRLVDENLEIGTEEAYQMVKRLAQKEGLFVGLSSGAAMVAALRVAEKLSEGVVVTIFPDDGSKYLSLPFWKEG